MSLVDIFMVVLVIGNGRSTQLLVTEEREESVSKEIVPIRNDIDNAAAGRNHGTNKLKVTDSTQRIKTYSLNEEVGAIPRDSPGRAATFVPCAGALHKINAMDLTDG